MDGMVDATSPEAEPAPRGLEQDEVPPADEVARERAKLLAFPLGHDATIATAWGDVTLPVLDPTRVLVDGEPWPFDDFGSHDCLGLGVHPHVRAAALVATREQGTGDTGLGEARRRLERALADLHGTDDALVFAAADLARLAALSTFAGRTTRVFARAPDAAPFAEALRTTGAEVSPIEGPAALARALAALECPVDDALVLLEGLSARDGDVAPLAALLSSAERFALPLFLDESHATLAIGDEGRGTCEHLGLAADRVALHLGSFEDAFGGVGGYVAGQAVFVDALRRLAPRAWFERGHTAANLAGCLAALEVVSSEPDRRLRLRRNADLLRRGLGGLGFDLCGSAGWVIPLRLGSRDQALTLCARLRGAGILVSPDLSPGDARVRLLTSSEHSPGQLARLLEVVAAFARGVV